MMPEGPSRRRGFFPAVDARGASYLEVLVAIVLVAACLVPAMESLRTAVLGGRAREAMEVDHLLLRSKMEQVLSEPFSTISMAAIAAGGGAVPTSYSDTVVTTDGRQVTRQVYLAPSDGDGDGLPDVGLLLVRVEIDGTAFRLQSLVSW